MTTQIVLVPGFWLGAWAWDDVAALLEGRGFNVDALPPAGSLAARASQITDILDASAERRVLVAHSGAAFPATLAIDQRPELIDHLVLVDTAPAANGLAFNAEAPGDFTIEMAWDSLEAEGSMRDLTPEQLETMRERAVPEPVEMVAAPVTLTNPERLQVPLTVICTAFNAEQYQEAAAQGVPYFVALDDYADVDYVDLPTGHWPMWSKPAELAELIAEVG